MDAEKLLQAFTPEETQELAAALPADVIQAEALRRGIELPAAAGAVAVEGATAEVLSSDADVKELIKTQLGVSRDAYTSVLTSIDELHGPVHAHEVADAETFEQEFDAWMTDEKVAYVRAAQEADPDLRFTLVATPNVMVSPTDIMKTAKKFGKDQPYETYVYEKLYEKYSYEQLSGTRPENGNKVQFSLIPSTLNPELTGTVAEQRAKLAELQETNPDLKVPSVLDAVTYWQTLRSANGEVADFDATYIRHFDLPDQRVGGSLFVPDSFVSDFGSAYLIGSYVRNGGDARVSVG